MNNEDCIILGTRQPSKGEGSQMVISLAKKSGAIKRVWQQKGLGSLDLANLQQEFLIIYLKMVRKLVKCRLPLQWEARRAPPDDNPSAKLSI